MHKIGEGGRGVPKASRIILHRHGQKCRIVIFVPVDFHMHNKVETFKPEDEVVVMYLLGVGKG